MLIARGLCAEKRLEKENKEEGRENNQLYNSLNLKTGSRHTVPAGDLLASYLTLRNEKSVGGMLESATSLVRRFFSVSL